MGLSPELYGVVLDAFRLRQADGLTIPLIEPNATLAFELAHRGYLACPAVVDGSTGEMSTSGALRSAYLRD
jgi:branched-chain amino acid transport system ATP-binding protein